jgi:SAM-dependent methyltransferase
VAVVRQLHWRAGMSASMASQSLSLMTFPGIGGGRSARSWTARAQDWLTARSRIRLAPRRRAALLERLVDAPEEDVLTLDSQWGTPAGRIMRLLKEADGSAGTIISVGALADATDIEDMLREIKRVLRPGGRLLFVEPVTAAAGTRMRRLQKIWLGGWRVLAGALKAPRDLWNDLRVARFDRVTFQRRNLTALGGLPVPHLVGEAVLPALHRQPAPSIPRGSRPRDMSIVRSSLGLSLGGPSFAFFG